MRDELTGLLEIFHKVEETGGKATLSITTSMGLTKTKLEIVSPTPGSTASTSVSSPPAPGNQAAGRRRRRNRGAAARARRNQRAATSLATLAEVDPPPRLPPAPLLHPLQHLLSIPNLRKAPGHVFGEAGDANLLQPQPGRILLYSSCTTISLNTLSLLR